MTPLSVRERDIVDALCRGESNKQIARSCRLSESTVKVHMKAIMRKMGAHSRTQIVILANGHAAANHLRAAVASPLPPSPSPPYPDHLQRWLLVRQVLDLLCTLVSQEIRSASQCAGVASEVRGMPAPVDEGLAGRAAEHGAYPAAKP